MISVHNIFVCKPGNASKLAKLMNEMPKTDKGPFIMTDVTGQFHRVVMVQNFENLSAYEAETAKMMTDSPEQKAMQEKFKDMNDMYTSGSREIYKIW